MAAESAGEENLRGNVRIVFPHDEQLLQTASVDGPVEYLTVYNIQEFRTQALSWLRIRSEILVSECLRPWGKIFKCGFLLVLKPGVKQISIVVSSPCGTWSADFGGTCCLVIWPPSLWGCKPRGTLLKPARTSAGGWVIPSLQLSEDQKLYMMAVWLIFGVKSFVDFRYLPSLPTYSRMCVQSFLLYIPSGLLRKTSAVGTLTGSESQALIDLWPVYSARLPSSPHLLMLLTTNDSTCGCSCHGTRAGSLLWLTLMYKL